MELQIRKVPRNKVKGQREMERDRQGEGERDRQTE